jgi:hypothetical protein
LFLGGEPVDVCGAVRHDTAMGSSGRLSNGMKQLDDGLDSTTETKGNMHAHMLFYRPLLATDFRMRCSDANRHGKSLDGRCDQRVHPFQHCPYDLFHINTSEYMVAIR